MSSENDPSPTFRLRLTERAHRSLDEATIHFAETASPEVAVAWREGFYAILSPLSDAPRRFPRASEPFHREVRQVIYRRPSSRVAYRGLFTITGEEESSPDAPTVVILLVRHGAARPLTRAEVRAVESDE